MASISISTTSSLPFINSSPHRLTGRKVSVNVTSLQSRRIGFRPIRISAVQASVERPVSHITSHASLYDVLGVQMGATCQEIKQAYRRLARVSHPDVASNGQNSSSADEFMRIHGAYATLTDPEKRADYDRTLFRRRSPAVSPFAMSDSVMAMAGSGSGSSEIRYSRYTRRSWETDQCW